jgi:xylulokinase
MQDLGLVVERIYASGGAVRSVLWRQMLADVFQIEIATTNVAEGAAYGAAMLAGIGTGQYADAVEAAGALIRVTDVVAPDRAAAGAYEAAYEVYRSLYPQLSGSFRSLTGLAGGEGAE